MEAHPTTSFYHEQIFCFKIPTVKPLNLDLVMSVVSRVMHPKGQHVVEAGESEGRTQPHCAFAPLDKLVMRPQENTTSPRAVDGWRQMGFLLVTNISLVRHCDDWQPTTMPS